MRIRAILASASLLLVSSVTFAQTVSHQVDRGTNVGKYKTYAWALAVEIVDPKTKKTVWRGTITNAIDSYADAETRDRNINDAAAKLFQTFLSKR
jgi:Domain of unknown function (DUF4136)